MKNKDLNTFITDKLNQGNGLRYKEAYWNDMSKMLDANLPVIQQEAATQSSGNVQGSTSTLSWVYISSALAAVIAASAMYFAPINSSTVVPAEEIHASPKTTTNITAKPSTINALTNTPQQTIETVPSKHNTIPENNELLQSQNTSASFPENEGLATSVTTGLSTPNGTDNNGNSNIAPIPSSQSDDDQITTHPVYFEPINPISENKLVDYSFADKSQTLPLPPKQHGKLIDHIAIAPFAAMVMETGNQSYKSANIEYIHPAQSNWMYGVNIECAGKHLALRSGIGMATTLFETHTTTARHLYDTDTQYVILDPFYGTTQSGKPIALIQQQIDSSYTSSVYTTSLQHVTYQYLVVPLTLQYRITHKRLALVLEGGGLHQFLISKPNSNKPQAEENHFTIPTYSFQLTAGSSIRYALSSQWAIGAQYNYNMNPSGANPHLLNNAHQATLMLIWSIR